MYAVLSQAGATPWLVPSRILAFGVGIGLTFSTDANMTVTVQHTFDVPVNRVVTFSRSGTTATITDTAHQLLSSDNVVIQTDPIFAGAYDITVTNANTYTITVPNSGATSGSWTIQPFRVFNNDDARLVNVLGTPPQRVGGNYAFPIAASRLKCTAYTAGNATLTLLQSYGS